MAAGDLLSLAGWYFLPQLVTGWLQAAYYAIWIRAGEPKPQPGSPRFMKHRKRIHILVIVAYLLYTIYEADWQILQARDFYQDLGVPLDVDERGLNARFRRLTIQYHPDKVSSPGDKALAESFYVHLKICRDTLLDPAKRFAYDRFGPEMLQWRHCKTINEFVLNGVRNTSIYYLATAVVVLLITMFGPVQQGTFWRYWALASMSMIELHTLTRPEAPSVLTNVINPVVTALKSHPPYLQFQALLLARKLMLSFFIALSQLGPLLFPPSSGQAGDRIRGQQLDRLEALTKASDQEVSRLLGLEVTPFAHDPALQRDLRAAMRTWLVDNTVRSNAAVQDAIGRVVQRRRADAPAGARPH